MSDFTVNDLPPEQQEHIRRLNEGTRVYRGDTYSIRYGTLLESPEIATILANLREKRFKIGRSEVSSRVVNHWEAEGIVEDPRESGQGWRRYSLMDLVWLGSILELRGFGVPTATLGKAKSNLRQMDDGRLDPDAPYTFEFYVLLALQQVPVFLLVFASGEVELATEREYATAGHLWPLADHVRINLNAVVQKALPKLDTRPDYRPGIDVTDAEIKVILAIRRGDNRRVTVRLKEGEPMMLESERSADGKTIQEMLDQAPHLDMTVKKQNGKTVDLSVVLREKL